MLDAVWTRGQAFAALALVGYGSSVKGGNEFQQLERVWLTRLLTDCLYTHQQVEDSHLWPHVVSTS